METKENGKSITKKSSATNRLAMIVDSLAKKAGSEQKVVEEKRVPRENIPVVARSIDEGSTVESLKSDEDSTKEDVPALSSIEEIPVAWEDCSSIGDVIEGTCIMAMKTPKCEKFEIPKDKQFHCSDVLPLAEKKGKKVGAIISVDFTTKYYHRSEFKKDNIQYRRITDHNVDFPEFDGLCYFQKTIRKFEQEFPESVVLVHCHLGLDRSAHFICSYLVKEKGRTPEEALQDFEKARGHPIYNRKNCLKFLKELQERKKENPLDKRFPPDRWTDYSKVGDVVAGSRFVAMKVPLKDRLTRGVNDEDKFTCEDVVELVKQKGRAIGMIVDLTDTDKYYQPETFVNMGILHTKMKVPGQVIPPKSLVLKFKKLVNDFEDANKDNKNVIVVHCTHGLNRTGYFVCKFMIDELSVQAEEAITRFNEARGHSMERESYLNDLRQNGARKRPASDYADNDVTPKRSSIRRHEDIDFTQDYVEQELTESFHSNRSFDQNPYKRSFHFGRRGGPAHFNRNFERYPYGRRSFHSGRYGSHYDTIIGSRSFRERWSNLDPNQESRFADMSADEILSSMGRSFYPDRRCAEETDISASQGHGNSSNNGNSDRHHVEERILYNDPSSKTSSRAHRSFAEDASPHDRSYYMQPPLGLGSGYEQASSGDASRPHDQYSNDDQKFSFAPERSLSQRPLSTSQQPSPNKST